VRVAGAEDLVIEDNETTLPQLHERIEKTLEYLKGVKPDGFAGKEDNEVTMKAGPNVCFLPPTI